jgi:hypothetical protein
MTSGNYSLINLVIHELVTREGMGYGEAIDRFYTSKLFALMQDTSANTYNTWAAADLVDEMHRLEALDVFG